MARSNGGLCDIIWDIYVFRILLLYILHNIYSLLKNFNREQISSSIYRAMYIVLLVY